MFFYPYICREKFLTGASEFPVFVCLLSPPSLSTAFYAVSSSPSSPRILFISQLKVRLFLYCACREKFLTGVSEFPVFVYPLFPFHFRACVPILLCQSLRHSSHFSVLP